MKEEILEFIYRRFQKDCNWTSGNCYYFAVILEERFDCGEIWYDTTCGHFVWGHYEIGYYDRNGEYKPENMNLIPWTGFSLYDEKQYKRIVQGCIM